MNISMEDLNDGQYEALKQFKKNVSDILPADYPDVWLIKFLRSHNYSLKKTETLFRGIMRTRDIYELETILETYVRPEVCAKYEFTSSLGIAKNGTPIRYTQFGKGDLIGFMMSISGYEVSYYCTYLLEYDLDILRKENERSGRQMSEITYILDMEGFSLQRMMHRGAIEMAMDLVQMMQNHYPEVWGNIFIINAPNYFDKFFHMFKPIIRMSMLKKIRVASKESTAALLLKYIDEDVLPAFLGGKRLDSFGNPRCSEFVKFGGVVPEEYYLRNRTPLMPTDAGVTHVWIAARSVYNYSVVVRKADSRMRVEIRSENGSIGLKMLFRPFGGDPENLDLPANNEYLDESNASSNVLYVSPYLRMQTHTTPIDQMVRAPWPGIYIFRFDNTYSWFTAKKIITRIQLVQES